MSGNRRGFPKPNILALVARTPQHTSRARRTSLPPRPPQRGGGTTALPKGQGEPAGYETEAAERGDGAEEAEALRVEGQGVQAAAEHGHAGGEEGAGDGVAAGDEQGDRVDELAGVVSVSASPVGAFQHFMLRLRGCAMVM